jgi:hypothetical protein
LENPPEIFGITKLESGILIFIPFGINVCDIAFQTVKLMDFQVVLERLAGLIDTLVVRKKHKGGPTWC